MTFIQKINNILPSMRSLVKYFAIAILSFGFLFVVWFAFFLKWHFIVLTPDGFSPDMTLTGAIGDFVGGIVGTTFSFAATLLVIVTLMEQNYQNKRNIFVQSYYEMLLVHSDHVRQICLQKQEKTYKGREVFSHLIKSYNAIFDHIDNYVQNIINGGLQGHKDEDKILSYLSDKNRRLSLTMRLSYGYFFYGSESYRLRNSNDAVEKLVEDCIISLGKNCQFFTRGYHVILGHYFRHMFQMVQYVINANYLKESERYTYVKQLRAQLDDDEQLLLYYNAMAEVGHEWIIPSKNIFDKVEQMCPLARFRMIKNIPAPLVIKGINPSEQFKYEIEFYRKHSIQFFEQR